MTNLCAAPCVRKSPALQTVSILMASTRVRVRSTSTYTGTYVPVRTVYEYSTGTRTVTLLVIRPYMRVSLTVLSTVLVQKVLGIRGSSVPAVRTTRTGSLVVPLLLYQEKGAESCR